MPQDVEDTWGRVEQLKMSVSVRSIHANRGCFSCTAERGCSQHGGLGISAAGANAWWAKSHHADSQAVGPSYTICYGPTSQVGCVQASRYQAEVSCIGAVHGRSEYDTAFAFKWSCRWAKRSCSNGSGENLHVRRWNLGRSIRNTPSGHPSQGSGMHWFLKPGYSPFGRKRRPCGSWAPSWTSSARTQINWTAKV